MIRRTVFFVLTVAILADLYIWWRYLLPDVSPMVQCLWWLPTLLMLIATWALYSRRCNHTQIIRFIFGQLLCLSLPKMIFVPVSLLLGWQAGLVAGTIIFLSALYGLVLGWRRLKVRHVKVTFPSLPSAFDGYRIVHFSDLHLGSFGGRKKLVERIVEAINAEHPDMIVFTGDIVNQHADELTPYIYTLSRLESRDGTYAVLGNHDFVANVQALCSKVREMGWHLLRNAHVELRRGNDIITLIGVDNISEWVFARHGNLSQATNDINADGFQILLTHDPSHWRMEVVGDKKIALTLSGHTHAGQLRLWRWSVAQRFAREWWGWYVEGSQRLHVSAGIGGNFPFRLGAWPELTVILCGRTEN